MFTEPPDPARDAEIIRLMRTGKVQGVERLLHDIAPLTKACLRVQFRLHDDDHALADALHDAALKLSTKARDLDPAENLGGYYYTTAKRLLITHLRFHNHHKRLWDGAEEQIADDTLDAAESSSESDITQRVAAVIDRLPMRERDILCLDLASNFQMKSAAIAKQLGTTAGTVDSLRHRTKRRLQLLLAPERLPEARP